MGVNLFDLVVIISALVTFASVFPEEGSPRRMSTLTATSSLDCYFLICLKGRSRRSTSREDTESHEGEHEHEHKHEHNEYIELYQRDQPHEPRAPLSHSQDSQGEREADTLGQELSRLRAELNERNLRLEVSLSPRFRVFLRFRLRFAFA